MFSQFFFLFAFFYFFSTKNENLSTEKDNLFQERWIFLPIRKKNEEVCQKHVNVERDESNRKHEKRIRDGKRCEKKKK